MHQLTFHLEATLEDLLRFRSANGDMGRDFLVTTDTEGSDGQARLGKHRLLTSELLKHARCTGETIATLSDANVKDELVHLQLAHGVGQILLAANHLDGFAANRECSGSRCCAMNFPDGLAIAPKIVLGSGHSYDSAIGGVTGDDAVP